MAPKDTPGIIPYTTIDNNSCKSYFLSVYGKEDILLTSRLDAEGFSCRCPRKGSCERREINTWTPKDVERQIYSMTTSRYDENGARNPNSSRPLASHFVFHVNLRNNKPA